MKSNLVLFITLSISISTYSQNQTADSLRYKIGQMLMIGFRDTVISESSHIINDIKKYNIGGVVLYEYDSPTRSRPRNISSKKQLIKLNKDLQKHAKTPLFIGIDEEGGKVSRLKTKYGFKPTVSAQYLGKINNADSSRNYAKQIAKACKAMGINMNFAPVVDVNTNPDCPVIGGIERSFSNNADSVIFHANIFIEEHKKQGVFCSLKHFPGHGSSKNDSHQGFTDVTHTWQKIELAPFKHILNQDNYPMVMTSHVFNKNIDSVYPATLSKVTLDLLRNEMNYDGLILSDDMMMLAIAANYGLPEALKQSINAGVDVLIFSNNIDRYNPNIAEIVINTILELVNSGDISAERINESYQRILLSKKQLN